MRACDSKKLPAIPVSSGESIVNGWRRRLCPTLLGDEAAACATCEFQRVSHNVCKRFRLRARQGNVDQRRDNSHQRPMQNETGFDPPTHPERCQEARDEGTGRSSVLQEIAAETYPKRNNCENESYFREQPAEQNSSPVDCCVTHFPALCRT